MDENEISNKIVGVAIEVHRSLGPGLLESTYEECLCHELFLTQIPFERQAALPIVYKGNRLDCGYRVDIIVDRKVILELKSVAEILPIRKAQLLTYLKLSVLKLPQSSQRTQSIIVTILAPFAFFAVRYLYSPKRSPETNTGRN